MPLTAGLVLGGGAVAGGVLNYLGSQNAANAAQGAAEAQAAQAAANRNQIMGYSNTWGQNVTSLSQSTPQELRALSASYGSAMQNLQQQQQLMSSIDPALMSASKQALSILEGGTTAAMTQPVMALRNQQRQQLMQQLQSQYGPGAESTSVGQQALNQFDMQTQGMVTGQMDNLFRIATSGAPNYNMQSALAGMQTVGQGYGALQQRQLNAQMNVGGATLGALSGTGQQMLQTAGAPFVGGALQGQGMASLGNNFMNAGTSLGMAYGMRGGGPGGGSTNNFYGSGGGGNPAAGFQGSSYFGSANPYVN